MAVRTIDVMALSLGDREIRPLTADEVMQMVRVGILGEDDRVELLHGALTQMSPQDPPHAVPVQRLTRWLAPLMVAGTHDVRVQLPMRSPDPTSMPEPDIAVVEHDDSASMLVHPMAGVLVIEVAYSSLRTDTRIKTVLYAAAAVPEYWVVDVAGRRLLVFTDPGVDGYATRTVLGLQDAARPRKLEVGPLHLAELFAGLPD